MTCTPTGSPLRSCRRLEGRKLVAAGTTMMKTSLVFGSTQVLLSVVAVVQRGKDPPPSAAVRVSPLHSSTSLNPSPSESPVDAAVQSTAASAGAGEMAMANARTAAATIMSPWAALNATACFDTMAPLSCSARLLPGDQPDAVRAGE